MKNEYKVKQKKEEKEEDLLNLDNVVSVGVGTKKRKGKDTGEPAIVVGVTKKKSEVELDSNQVVPSDVDGIKTDVIEIGEPRAPPEMDEGTVDKIKRTLQRLNPFSKEEHRDRFRPVQMGVSIGHYMITAGTSSFILVDDDGNEFPASNNHVLARSNKASPGDIIIQPGAYDEGKKNKDKVGVLKDYVPVKNSSTVDLAWLEPTENFVNQTFEMNGDIKKPKDVKVGDTVKKTGRTTGVTEGKVMQKNASVRVKYPDGTIKMKDQIICSSFSKGGDSGSPVFLEEDDSLYPVGLLFAGSKSATIINDIDNVIEESGMTIKTDDDEGNEGDDDNNEDDDDDSLTFLELLMKLIKWFLDKKKNKNR